MTSGHPEPAACVLELAARAVEPAACALELAARAGLGTADCKVLERCGHGLRYVDEECDDGAGSYDRFEGT